MKPDDELPYIFVSFWETTNKIDSSEFSFVKLKPINVSVKDQHIGTIMKKIGLLLVGMLLSTSVLAEGAMRCGSSIISVGDTKSEMLMKCGTPISTDVKTTVTENENGTKSVIQTGEIFTIDMGKDKFMALVTVENGVITHIEDGPRNE